MLYLHDVNRLDRGDSLFHCEVAASCHVLWRKCYCSAASHHDCDSLSYQLHNRPFQCDKAYSVWWRVGDRREAVSRHQSIRGSAGWVRGWRDFLSALEPLTSLLQKYIFPVEINSVLLLLLSLLFLLVCHVFSQFQQKQQFYITPPVGLLGCYCFSACQNVSRVRTPTLKLVL